MEHTNSSTVVVRTQISHCYKNHHDCHDVSRHVIIFREEMAMAPGSVCPHSL